MNKRDIRSMNIQELEEFMVELGQQKFRSKQIFQWINKKLVTSFDDMTSLSKELRERLFLHADIGGVRIIEKLESAFDNSKKYLFELENSTIIEKVHSKENNIINKNSVIIESVLMKYSFGNSVCVSSQAGCKMGCVFCASTKSGMDRNLTSGEMCAQVYEIQKSICERISNVVVMGSGEPFDNYDNVIKFIRILNSEDGLGIGQRHITVSTCGIVERIYDFTGEGLQSNLAVSLHAPNDEIRRKLMPVAKKYKIDEILKACNEYSKKSGRRVTYEYAMVSNVNDGLDCAKELGGRLKSTLSHVNLIPVNEIAESGCAGSGAEAVMTFKNKLESYGVETTVRRKLGNDINASCGQLRNSKIPHIG